MYSLWIPLLSIFKFIACGWKASPVRLGAVISELFGSLILTPVMAALSLSSFCLAK